jgi:glycosyltransferase involved in cell wall biosynthesis
MIMNSPLVSIGLPVYNGERYLADALDSLVAQDYKEFELIISDNASTDATSAICRQYAGRDKRIKLQRNAMNIGAARNFTEVFRKSRGTYFMWAAHDDLWHPTYVRRCVEVLDERPDVVLCGSNITFIDERGAAIPYEGFNRLNTHSMNLRRRVSALSERLGWFLLSSLLRPAALRKTRLYTEAFGGDVILLMELLFLGTTYILPEKLFTCRVIPKSSERYFEDISGSRSWRGASKAYTGLARSLLQVIDNSRSSARDKAKMREDLLQNVGRKNKAWSDLIVHENLALACVPSHQRFVEIRALLAPETPLVELDMLRAAANKAAIRTRTINKIGRFFERCIPMRTMNRVRRFLERYIRWRLRRIW